MNYFHKLIRSLSFFEKLIPKKSRLPFQYFVQKIILALDKEFQILHDLIDKDKISIDIGANKGIYAYYLSKKCKHVYCFEPLIECCHYINDYSSKTISVLNCALSNTENSLELYIPIINNKQVYTRSSLKPLQNDFIKRSVKVTTLDSYKYDNVGFIKIDVEGVEFSVLEGALHTIKQSKPNLLVEIDINQHSDETFLQVFSLLYRYDYQSYVVINKELTPCTNKELSMGQNHYNFIFKHPSYKFDP